MLFSGPLFGSITMALSSDDGTQLAELQMTSERVTVNRIGRIFHSTAFGFERILIILTTAGRTQK